jgi:hypothetical protein
MAKFEGVQFDGAAGEKLQEFGARDQVDCG